MSEYITISNSAKNITGHRFGQLLVLGPIGRQRDCIVWLCNCDCGSLVGANGRLLRSGKTRSCGCLQKRIAADRMTIHGMYGSKNYVIWISIIKRCTNPNSQSFADYGGRGISIHDKWRHDFMAFQDYVAGLPNHGESGYTLDRIDNDGSYVPGNIKWSTRKEQCRNTRRNIVLTHNGKTQCVAAWAEELRISASTIHHRLYAGWDVERALTTPTRKAKTDGS